MRRHVLAAWGIVSLSGAVLGQGDDAARAYATELARDAAGRTNLLAEESTITFGGATQFRFSVNKRDDDGLDEDVTTGFHARQTTAYATGAVDERFSYRVQGNFASDGGGFSLEDAYVVYAVNDNWAIGVGQVYFPVLWEEHVAYQYGSLAAEPSAFESAFRVNRVQGAWAQYSSDDFRGWVAFHDGAGTLNTEFTSMAEADYAFTARGEYKIDGSWDRFNDFTSFRGSEQAAKVGVCAHYQGGGNTFGTADMDVWLVTGDVQWEGDGWNAFAAGVYRGIDPAGGDTLNDFGFVVQGGIFLTDEWELFGRYDAVFADDDRGAGTDDFHTLTVGVNHYFIPGSQAAKFTLDFQWFLDQQDASIVPASTALGLLPSSEDGQFNINAQLQLVVR